MYAQKLTQACIGLVQTHGTHTQAILQTTKTTTNYHLQKRMRIFFLGLFPALPLTHQHGQPA